MKEVIDRVPTRPGRIKLVDENTGAIKYYYLTREDEPTVDGTAINKELFDSIGSDLDDRYTKTEINDKLRVNLLCPTLRDVTKNGLTVTENNGVYTVNGTATQNTVFLLQGHMMYESFKNTKLIGCPPGGSSETYKLYVGYYDETNWLAERYDTGNGRTISFEGSYTIEIALFVSAGVVCNNLIFKPMITTDLNATYDDFVPFDDSLLYGRALSNVLRQDTVTSSGSNYGEVGMWEDRNPSEENRLYRFVTIAGANREIAIANSTSQIVGTSNKKENVGFLGNYTPEAEFDTSKVIISILGVSYVKTQDSSIVPNDRVMSDDNGYAVKSTNNLGYRVLKVLDNGLLEIVISPNTDMIQRVRHAIVNYTVISDEKPDTYPCMWFKVVE